MPKSEVNRQELIQRAIAKSMGEITDVSIKLWQPLTSQLINIIGRSGFNALYARSLYLANSDFPFLSLSDLSRPVDLQYLNLKVCLARQNPVDASQASLALLTIFTNILASLIGESLTTDILYAAWGNDDAQDTDIASKELPND